MTSLLVRSCRRFLAASVLTSRRPQFARHERMFDAAVWTVRFYYIANLYFVYSQLSRLRNEGLSQAALDLLWPVQWIAATGSETGSLILIHLSIVAGLLGVFWWRYRPVRVLVVVSQLLVAAYINSQGAINHSLHMWLWVGVCFVFLPSGAEGPAGRDRKTRITFLIAFSMVQGLVLMFYSLSGAYKVGWATVALMDERFGGFAPEAMALTLARRSLQTGTDPIWAPLVIEHPLVGWPLYLVLYYIEIAALLVFLRPRLHRLWGLALVLFHVGTFLFMSISFPAHVLLVTMLLIFSPFAPKRWSWRCALVQLPGLAAPVVAWRWITGRRSLQSEL